MANGAGTARHWKLLLAIGLLVGIELLFAGSALIMPALAGRQLARMR